MHDVACEFACAVRMGSSSGHERPLRTVPTNSKVFLHGLLNMRENPKRKLWVTTHFFEDN